MAKGTEYPGFETLGADIKEARKALGLSRRIGHCPGGAGSQPDRGELGGIPHRKTV